MHESKGGLRLMGTTMTLPTSIEASWIRCAKAGNDNAFFEFVKAFGRRIFRIAKYITQNDEDAEDVLVETFLKVRSDLDECREDEFSAWLVRTAISEAFWKLHNHSESHTILDDVDPCEGLVVREISVWGNDYQERYSAEQTTEILEDALRSLDPMCRAVFVLRDIEAISVEQTAQVLNLSSAAVAVRLLRARLQLREMLTRRFKQQVVSAL